MAKNLKIMSKKVGQSPGTLGYYGEHTYPVQISVVTYDEKQYAEYTIEDDFTAHLDPNHVTWIRITGIHDLTYLEKIGEAFSIHPLVLEDITSTGHRPKVEDYTDYGFLILQAFHRDGSVQPEQISVIIGKEVLITFQESPSEIFTPILDRIKNAKGKIRHRGTDFLAYAIMDIIVDNYFVMLEEVGEHLEDIEEELLQDPQPSTLWDIQGMKRKVMVLRRSLWPLREVVNTLEREDFEFMTQSTDLYLRDLYDHTIQIIEIIESFRDILSGLVDLYLSTVSNKMNEIMKVLTIIATIFIPLTFIAGIYGMNFIYMPELQITWGYPIILCIMIGIGVIMLMYFRKKRWL
jgi:magnesium transporter